MAPFLFLLVAAACSSAVLALTDLEKFNTLVCPNMFNPPLTSSCSVSIEAVSSASTSSSPIWNLRLNYSDAPFYQTGLPANFLDVMNTTEIYVLGYDSTIHGVLYKKTQCDSKNIEKMTLQNSKINPSNLGAIFCSNFKSLTVSNCSIEGGNLGLLLPASSPDLETLEISKCSLTGTIPSAIGLFKKLDLLVISSNFLTGTIPSVFKTAFDSAPQMDVSRNNLTGDLFGLPSGNTKHKVYGRNTSSEGNCFYCVPDQVKTCCSEDPILKKGLCPTDAEAPWVCGGRGPSAAVEPSVEPPTTTDLLATPANASLTSAGASLSVRTALLGLLCFVLL